MLSEEHKAYCRECIHGEKFFYPAREQNEEGIVRSGCRLLEDECAVQCQAQEGKPPTQFIARQEALRKCSLVWGLTFGIVMAQDRSREGQFYAQESADIAVSRMLRK